MAASERFKNEWQHIGGNRGSPVMDGERHGVAVFLRGEGNGRSTAVLYRVRNEIRYDLSQPVGVPLAAQITAPLPTQYGVRLAGTDLHDGLLAHVLKIG